MEFKGFLRTAFLLLAVLLAQGTWALASNTGGIEGKVTDQNGNPIGGVRVTAASPSQSARVTTGSNGFYSVLNLSPDTYSITASKDGFDTSTVSGITVQADQNTAADIKMHPTVRTLGRITTTATASVVSKTITGDLYAVNSRAINNYQGAQGGAETLYSQSGVVASLPGVVRMVGAGGGYTGQGTLSLRGGAQDQVGYEIEGVPLNRGFDFYNGTAFLTNGLSSLEIYTGGAPADAGRAMSGYINEQINRGKYPGGADFTAVAGSPLYNHTVQADIYGGTPDNRFTYYASTLATNAYYNFGDRSNLANSSYTIPANSPGCGAWNLTLGASAGPLNCSVANVVTMPQSNGSYASTPFAAQRDTVTNLHYNIAHNGLNDDVQALYTVGTTLSVPLGMYGTYGSDPNVSTFSSGTGYNGTGLTWPVGQFYSGLVGQPYNPSLNSALTWPTSHGSALVSSTGLTGGPMPSTFEDSQNTQYSIAKLGYTRALTQNSFLRIFGYSMYSAWNIDEPINGIVGGNFYQLHDNNTGVTLLYQNQVNQQNLLTFGADYNRDVTLRYNYVNYLTVTPTGFGGNNAPPTCGTAANPLATCGTSGAGALVTAINSPFSYWSSVTPLNWDGVISDKWKPANKLLFDLGLRYDIFGYQMMPGMAISGPNGLAQQAQVQQGQCLVGYNYSPTDPKHIGDGSQNCYDILQAKYGPTGTSPNPAFAPGGGAWPNPANYLGYQYWSPRFGTTYTLDPRDVVRFSVGRYVQPAKSAVQEYAQAPFWGPGATVNLLNHFYTGLGLYTVHNVLPEDSTNYDLSYEHEFNGGLSMKVTPFYRNTRNEVLNLAVNPQQPSFVTGLNFGATRAKGVEFLVAKNLTSANGVGGTLSATYNDSLLRFNAGSTGASYIDVINKQITAYNAYYHTNYTALDPTAYYPPSYVQTPAASPSYDVNWIINLTLDARSNGFDIVPTFNYQSGNPYGDPLIFNDPHCTAPGPSVNGCVPLPAGKAAPLGGIGPDPYTNQFDPIGSLKGPSWWALNLAVSHDIGHDLKASVLGLNLLSGVHNQGYPWEQPSNQSVVSYSDNQFYSIAPLGAVPPFSAKAANPANAYYGNDYYAYTASGILPLRTYVFSLSAKI